MFQVDFLHQKQFVSERQKFSNSFNLLVTLQKIIKFTFFKLHFLQTASGVRNIHVLNLFSCFWHVRNFSNVFSSTCFWRVRNIDVSNLSSLSETVCFWASEICSNLRSSNCFWSVRNFSTLFFRQPVSFKFIFLFLTRRNFFFYLFLRQTSLVVVNLHSLCKNMSFQTQILFRSVYEWSEFYF